MAETKIIEGKMKTRGFLTRIFDAVGIKNITSDRVKLGMVLGTIIVLFISAMVLTNGHSVKEKFLGENIQALENINDRLDNLEKKIDKFINGYKSND